MNVWIPDQPAREAIGELPAEIRCNFFPPEGPMPPELLGAEFLVPSTGVREAYRELLPQMRSLQVIQTLSAGIDWLAPLAPAGVVLCDASGTRDAPVAEWVLAAILSDLKGFPELRDNQRAHRWRWSPHADLRGKTVMILGYGAIGGAVEAYLKPFDVKLIRVARRARPGVHAVGELERLLPQSDVIVVLVPLIPETRGLLDRETLGLLRPGALIVNAARGPVIDTQDLVEVLQAGRARAVLDVTDPEPLPPEHPLWDAPGTFITPHYAGASGAADRLAFAFVGDQVRRFARGEPLLNVVEAGY